MSWIFDDTLFLISFEEKQRIILFQDFHGFLMTHHFKSVLKKKTGILLFQDFNEFFCYVLLFNMKSIVWLFSLDLGVSIVNTIISIFFS